MTDRDPTDDQVLDALRDALDEHVTLSEGFTDLVMAGYDLTTNDLLIAELTQDTDLQEEPVGVRSPDLGARLLTFASDHLTFEFEIGPRPPEIVGRLTPAGGGHLFLDQDGESTAIIVSDDGAFETPLRSSGPFRLRHVAEDGTSVATGWIVP